MSESWIDLPVNQPLYKNLSEDAVQGYQTAIENGYRNELGGQSRFPGMRDFATLEDNGRVVLSDFNGDLLAVTTKGQVYTIDRSGNVTNRTDAPVAGGLRPIIAKGDVETYFAAGGDLIRLRGEKTELLSPDAPQSSHVGWIDGYLLAPERNSGRLYRSGAREYSSWDPLNVYLADGNPDSINSMIITPYREIMLGGLNTIEQFERYPTGTEPFYKRWSIPDGVSVPYALTFADNKLWTINRKREVVQSSGQLTQAVSAAIGAYLESIDDWTDAWMGGYPDNPLHVNGQKFLVIQAPNATNPYGTKGVTLLLDYVKREWAELYGFDRNEGIPIRWPGWSHWSIWDKTFIGGEGKIYQLDTSLFTNAGIPSQWLIRTAHLTMGNAGHVKAFRLIVKRGMGGSATESKIWVRCSRDGKPFGTKMYRSLGKAGQRQMTLEFGQFGIASHFQFEIGCTDNVDVQLLKAQIKADPIGH